MNIINIFLSIICIFFAILLSFISPNDRIIKGSYENYFNIDDAIYTYAINETDKLIKGSSSPCKFNNKKIEYIIGGKNSKKNNIKKSWYLNSWNEVHNNLKIYKQFITDKKNSYNWIYYNWNNVINNVMPYIYTNKTEIIGVLRVNDNDELYVHDMSISPSMGESESYVASVSANLVHKYINIPGDFIFHTHPHNIGGDPFPSDGDIYISLLNALQNRFIADVVFCIYGVIIYFISSEKLNFLLEDKSYLKYFNYCYDLINAWNAYTNNASKHTYTEHVNFLNQWGYNMIIIPTDYYIALNYNKFIIPIKLIDRFTKTKYKLAESIKDNIIYLENKEKEQNIKKKRKK